MFKNRELKVAVVKKEKAQAAERMLVETKTFEDRTDYVLARLQKIGTRVFAGVCVYILLDTARQVAVAKATTDN